MPSVRDIDFTPELEIRTSRSGGSGGQNVNKVETRVELRFDIAASALLDDEQKHRLLTKLAARLVQESVLQIIVSEARTQQRNRTIAVERLYDVLEEALKMPKKRKPTKIPKSVKEKRLKDKKATSEKKANRNWQNE